LHHKNNLKNLNIFGRRASCACLKDVLTRLPGMTNHQIPEVLPAAWVKARLQVQRQAVTNVIAYMPWTLRLLPHCPRSA